MLAMMPSHDPITKTQSHVDTLHLLARQPGASRRWPLCVQFTCRGRSVICRRV